MWALQGGYAEAVSGREGVGAVDLTIKELRNVDIYESGNEVTIQLNEKDGNFYGTLSEIKIPATSYCFLEEAIVERWLEKKKA